MNHRVAGGTRFVLALVLAATFAALVETAQAAAVTITKNSNTDWAISNGLISFVFNPSSDDVTSRSIGLRRRRQRESAEPQHS